MYIYLRTLASFVDQFFHTVGKLSANYMCRSVDATRSVVDRV